MTWLNDAAIAASILGTLLSLAGSVRTFQIVRNEARTRIAHSQQITLEAIARRDAEERQRRQGSKQQIGV